MNLISLNNMKKQYNEPTNNVYHNTGTNIHSQSYTNHTQHNKIQQMHIHRI